MAIFDLKFLIKLSPKAAIEYFKNKKNIPHEEWVKLREEASQKAFTIARITKLDILLDAKKLLEEALENGISYHQFRKDIIMSFQKKGWLGTEEGEEVLKPWRLKDIYYTNIHTSYSGGRYKTMKANVKNRPYWQYWTVGDNRVRKEHEELHGLVFPHDDPFWKYYYTPNGNKCRCSTRALNKRDLKRENLEISSSKGKISFKEVPISKNSNIKKTVAVFDTGVKDPSTGKTIKVSPQVGWSYNPGEVSWKPDLQKYPKDLLEQYKKEVKK